MTKAAATFFLRNFAAALLDGEWTVPLMQARARKAWPRAVRKKRGWIADIHKAFPEKPSHDTLVAWLNRYPKYAGALIGSNHDSDRGSPIHIFLPAIEAGERTVAVTGELPEIRTLGRLAYFLKLTPGQLTVYADLLRLNRLRPLRDARRNPYRYRVVGKRSAPAPPPVAPRPAGFWHRLFGPPAPVPQMSGPLMPPAVRVVPEKCRLLEIPKPRLKRGQRWILDEILARLPVHDAAHGFVAGRSILTNATLHANKAVVVRFDLKNFFPSVPATRVRGVFAKLGFSQSVSHALMGLCTTVLPDEVEFVDAATRAVWRRPHLPQGAPTSPALANLCAYRMDCRLAGLAARFGATYTRYADDLTFSGGHDLRRAQLRLRKWVIRVVTQEGFTLNAAKTRVKSQSDRQTVTGLVVNVKPNVRRTDFDRLKATLTNCVRHGPASQNLEKVPHFREHLRGRVAHVVNVNPARGAKLLAIFGRISWPASA